MQSQLSSTLQILLAHFHGQFLIPFTDASQSAGISPQTARNLNSQNKFPIRTEKRGARRFVHIEDLAAYIDSQRELNVNPRGRPTKARKKQIEERGRAA